MSQRPTNKEELERLKKALEESSRIAALSKYDDDTGPMPISYAIAAYGMLRVAGKSPIEITQLFRDLPEMLGEEPELAEGAKVPLVQLEKDARKLGVAIKQAVGPGVGFVVVLYNYGGGGNMTFLSSGKRDDTIMMLNELLSKLAADKGQLA